MKLKAGNYSFKDPNRTGNIYLTKQEQEFKTAEDKAAFKKKQYEKAREILGDDVSEKELTKFVREKMSESKKKWTYIGNWDDDNDPAVAAEKAKMSREEKKVMEELAYKHRLEIKYEQNWIKETIAFLNKDKEAWEEPIGLKEARQLYKNQKDETIKRIMKTEKISQIAARMKYKEEVQEKAKKLFFK